MQIFQYKPGKVSPDKFYVQDFVLGGGGFRLTTAGHVLGIKAGHTFFLYNFINIIQYEVKLKHFSICIQSGGH